MGIKEYFAAHPTQKWYFKHGVVLIAGAVITLGLQAVAGGQIPLAYAGFVAYALNMANEKLRLIDADAPWPVVGAKAKKR